MPLTRNQIQQAIFDHYAGVLPSARLIVSSQWGDPGGETPVVFVMSEHTDHKNLNGNFYQLSHVIGLHVLVLDTRLEDGYIAADADEVMNALNQEIVDGFEALMTDTRWQRIEWAVPSAVMPKEEFTGHVYRHEVYLFRVSP